MKKRLRKYIKELDQILTHEATDVKLVATITIRLSHITKKSELRHFIDTITTFRDISTYTASDFKFYDRVISRLTKILNKDK